MVVLVGLLAAANAIAARPDPHESLLKRLAADIGDESELVRADFAASALSEMLIAHERELDALSVPRRLSRDERAKQARWQRAAREFVDALYAARDAVDAGAEVQILSDGPGPVRLLIGDRLVLVTSPRIEDPGPLERAVVEVFCALYPCDPRTLEDSAREAASALAPAAGWSFARGLGSTYETADGLGFMFSDVRGRARKERLCRGLAAELRRLSAALADARARGLRVDWDSLALRVDRAGGDPQLLIGQRHALRLALPLLAQAPGVVAVARPWLRARASGSAYRQYFPRAELLLSELLQRADGPR